MKIYFFLLAFLAISCSTGKSTPENLLPKNKMVKLLIDIHLVESAISVKNLSKDSSEVLYRLYEKEILKKHHISESDYKSNITYYTKNAKLLDEIYEIVIDSLSLREVQKKL